MALKEVKRILLVVMRDRPGALLKVAGLVSRRRFKVDSMSFIRVEGGQVIKLTLLVHGDEGRTEQLRRQVVKIIDILEVSVLKEKSDISADLALIRLSFGTSCSENLMELIKCFEARIVGVGDNEITLRMADSSERIDSFISLVPEGRILDISRTGVTALINRSNKER